MFTSILTPVDGSPPSDAAVKLAVRLAAERKAKLVFVHAIAMPLPIHDAGGFAREQMLEEENARAKQILDAAMQAATAAGVAAQTTVVGGAVTDAVLETAQDHGSDVIVMGSHGRSGIVRAVLGSKTAEVLARATIPVLVAPHVP